MTQLSEEQNAIIQAPLVPLSVVACAGSGKTITSVNRLVEIRKRLNVDPCRIALLSFSNVAVDTFRKKYQQLAHNLPIGRGRNRVEIDTLDAFIINNILRPHGHRTMRSTKIPFLVNGGEPFLNSFKIWRRSGEKSIPDDITNLQVGYNEYGWKFFGKSNGIEYDVQSEYGKTVIEKLGKTGSYTHNLGRYWSLRVLHEQPWVLRSLAHRFQHILIDEAQDIGSLHQLFLELLIANRVQVSLIGDTNQAIYEFADANGQFLNGFSQNTGATCFALTQNFRSVQPILHVANNLSGRNDTAQRESPQTIHGAFFVPYLDTEIELLITAFQGITKNASLNLENSAVICRGKELVRKLSKIPSNIGQGVVKDFASAAILRDKKNDYINSFRKNVDAIFSLLSSFPNDLPSRIKHTPTGLFEKQLRRKIWDFTCSPDTGLPSSSLIASKDWHQFLKLRVIHLVDSLKEEFNLGILENIGLKLKKTGLPDTPLLDTVNFDESSRVSIKIETVHQVKGESLDAVLYLATKQNILSMINGVSTEEGRIGYVAVTRARNLFWLAVPKDGLSTLRVKLCVHSRAVH